MANTHLSRNNFVSINHLQLAWRQAVRERIDPHLAVDREERVFSIIADCDPTDEGRYLLWLSRWRRERWAESGLKAACHLSEIQELNAALAHFDEARRHLPPDRRDVNAYRTPQELIGVTAEMNLCGRLSYRRERKRLAMLDSDIIFSQPPWKLACLKSKAAAQWWGLGTRWCTSSASGGAFEAYAAKGNLMVLITPSGKYQFASATGEFKDAADRDASPEEVLADAPASLIDQVRSLWTK